MPCEIQPGCVSYVRAVWPNADISGTGGPFAVLRFPNVERPDRPAVIFFATKAEALDAGVTTGDRVIEARLHVPKIPKSKELGWD
jgi:hypothetical protein